MKREGLKKNHTYKMTSNGVAPIHVQVGGNEYLWDEEKNSMRRYNEEYKLWITINFAGEKEESVFDELIDRLTKEYIRQRLVALGERGGYHC